MSKFLIPIVFFISSINVYALGTDPLLEGDLIFNSASSHSPKIIEWIVVRNLENACYGKTKQQGQGELFGCAKFNNKKCYIYTKKRTSLSNLGHELRHCFEGQWHQED